MSEIKERFLAVVDDPNELLALFEELPGSIPANEILISLIEALKEFNSPVEIPKTKESGAQIEQMIHDYSNNVGERDALFSQIKSAVENGTGDLINYSEVGRLYRLAVGELSLPEDDKLVVFLIRMVTLLEDNLLNE